MPNPESASHPAPTAHRHTLFPALEPLVNAAQAPPPSPTVDRRVLRLCLLAVPLGIVAALVAQLLVGLISLITNLAYFGQWSLEFRSPAEAIPRLGWWSVPIPVIGALIVGLLARFGSKAIRGHGIPEAMEQVLTNESRIPARLTLLKPLSAAVSIGTGGPFGAEGPIIATGGALGSVVGQILHTTASERKTLLAAGAAAGMSATFGSPVSAVLLAVELLLFEFRPRSLIPVVFSAAAAAGTRILFEGMEPAFQMTDLQTIPATALAVYVALGAIMGLAAALVTRLVYFIEDLFESLPVHWMWWPALGAVVVGLVGLVEPRTLGVGYQNISDLLSNRLPLAAICMLSGFKLLSWSMSLGSGTSGGTLAPLFTIGGGLGALAGVLISQSLPALGVDPRVAALVGMAAIFSGASRAMLASAVFAFETTLQPLGLLPLLGGCAASMLVSSLLMRNSIMTEKISRRGIRTPDEYLADTLSQVLVRDAASSPVISLREDQSIGQVRDWLASDAPGSSHQGFPVLNASGSLVGILTRREVANHSLRVDQKVGDVAQRFVRFVYDDCTVRQAADHMVNHNIGRLPVVSRGPAPQLAGMLTRSDILSVFQRRIREAEVQEPTLFLPSGKKSAASRPAP